jgi:hypothetical protein
MLLQRLAFFEAAAGISWASGSRGIFVTVGMGLTIFSNFLFYF